MQFTTETTPATLIKSSGNPIQGLDLVPKSKEKA